MDDKIILSESINSSTKIRIKALNADLTSNEKVYAINWFNLKSPAIYWLYNLIVGPMLYKLGGRLFFKGRQIRKHEGSSTDQREMLLIVYYPSLAHFIQLLKKKSFQLASILRISSVKAFNFGFSKRLDDVGPPKSKKSENLSYLIHHYRKNNDHKASVDELKKILTGTDVSVYFYGEVAAKIIAKRGNKEPQEAPILMDGIIVYETNNSEQFEALLTSPQFAAFKSKFESNYIAEFNRIK